MATIIVTWTAGGGTNVVNQIVRRSISGANSYSILATVGATTTSYTDNTAANNTLYDYQIITNCNTGGPTINIGGYPSTIYIDCGSSDISASAQYNSFSQIYYPEITFTIYNRLNTDTKTYTYQWKDSGGTALDYQYTVNTQNAVTGTINSDQNGNALNFNTTYVLHVTFRSTDNLHSRDCTFSVTTPAQPVCDPATGLQLTNEYVTDFAFPVNSNPVGGGSNPIGGA